MWLLASTALAGELIVTTLGAVAVRIDGTPVAFVPGTTVAQVSGITGIHLVEITNAAGQRVAQMNVSVPQSGGSAVVFDGMNLVMASAGHGAIGVVGGVGVVGIPVPVAAPPAPAGPVAMEDAAFGQLLATVKGASFSDDKLGAIRAAVAGNWFSIAQVGQLVDVLDFGGDKVSAVAICRPRVVDPQNAFGLGSHFTFSSDRDAALKLFR